jgi:iron complex outermembrane receptor protein
MIRSSISLAALAAAIPLQPVSGQPADPPPAEPTDAPAEPDTAAEAHRQPEEERLVVTGVRRRESDVLAGVSVLDEDDLTREARPSLGETLARQPGVSATSFGPAASAPVLRGLSGDRVRVLTDGIGSFDLASAGPDHAVAVNPITAERIEVLRGPVALLFGSQAIGGVVNVIDSRIPRKRPEGAVRVKGLLSYGTAANERAANLGVDLPIGSRFVAHVDGNWSKSDDLRTGGHILSDEARAEALASGDPEIAALASLKGELPNSKAETKQGAAGLAYIDGDLNIGASVTRHLAEYQVPIRYALEAGGEGEAPTIDVEQTRYDARAEVPLDGFFNRLKARGGYSEYHHDELEDTGEIGSRFFSNGGEGRLELVQAERSGWGGTSGAQYLERDVKIRGEEKFLPDSRDRQAGLFTLQTLVRGPWRFEGGARIEFSKLTAEEDAQLGTASAAADFTSISGSVGAQYEFTRGWRAGLSLSRSERAPSLSELFSFGPHLASQSFEVGDPDLDTERSLSVEASLHGTAGPVHLVANAFYSHFSNFIFAAPTGEVEDDLPVFAFRGGKADFYGFEARAEARLGHALGIDWGGELQGDYVHAHVKGFGPAPFMPPLRLLGAVTGSRGRLDGRIEVEHAFAQNRTAEFETETDGYTMVNAGLEWHPLAGRPELTLALSGNNLFDVEARRSTSQLKDFAPLAGRDIRLTARFSL